MTGYHCSTTEREHWLPIPCPDKAVVIYEMKDGAKLGFCHRHRHHGEHHARVRGWTVLEPEKAAA